MFGYSDGELLGKTFDRLIAGANRQVLLTHFKDYMAKPLPRVLGRAVELHGLRKDGTQFQMDIAMNPYSVNADVLLNCVVRDLTASAAAQQECLRDLGSK